MSSHRMSASGDRPYTLNAGGGAFSGFSVPSKQTDALQAQISGFSKVEIPLSAGAKIQRIRYASKSRDGEVNHHEMLVLAVDKADGTSPNINVYGYPSGDADNAGPENTNFDIRKPGEKFGPLAYYDEAWEVVEEVTVETLLNPPPTEG